MNVFKKVTTLFIALIMILSILLTGCGSSSNGSLNKGNSGSNAKSKTNLPLIGDNLKYDPNKPVNNGKPITIKFWYQQEYDPYYKWLTKEYSKIHPNVKWQLVSMDYNNYFKKLPLALQNGTGPDIFHVHNQFTNVLVPHMAPYPENVLPLDKLKKDFVQVDAHLINGKLYYIDFGIMTSGIFYNKKMWKDAGLTDNDIPKTWDQLVAVAKKLTKKDANGNIKVAGFNMNTYMQYLWIAMQYQQGRFLFTPDGKSAVVNTPEGVKTAKMLYDWYNVDKIGTTKQAQVDQAFGNGQAAMVYCWAWLGNTLKLNYPNIEYGYFPLPTFDGKTPPAYDRNNGESSNGVNAKADAAHKAVGFDFIKFELANDKFLIMVDKSFLIAPSKISLMNSPEIKNDPIISVEAKMIERTVWPGPAPDPYYTGLQKYLGDAVMLNHVSPDTAVKQAEERINKDLKQTDFKAVEHQYKYANELK